MSGVEPGVTLGPPLPVLREAPYYEFEKGPPGMRPARLPEHSSHWAELL